MQQMQAFPTDAFQQTRCTGIGNLGIGTALSGGTGKHYKAVHGNVAFGNFNSFIHSGDPEIRGMTRIVFNGNGNRNDFHCGADNFQNCITGEIIDNTGNYQLNFVNTNANMRYMRQQMNPSFQGDNQLQRCYIQRPQGQQARFVRVQGSKMRPNVSFRNYNNNQQRQKQNRRFNTKGFNNNNYKTQKGGGGGGGVSNEGFFEEEENDSSSPKRCREQQDVREKEMDRKITTSRTKQESQQQSKPKACRSTSPMDSYNNRASKTCDLSSVLLEPKVEYVGNPSHDLSYDDITENSDDNDDSDLREHLIRKKNDQIIKREPGELESEDDETEPQLEKAASETRKSKKASVNDDNIRKYKNSDTASSSEGKSKDSKTFQRLGRKDHGKNFAQGLYSCHDNCYSPSREGNIIPTHKSTYSGTRHYSSTYSDRTTQNYCCPESEVSDLKEKIGSMKQALRETQDKLLESNVVASKKALRMQEEINHLKKQLEEAAKTETELKTSLKNFEKDLSAKTVELAKASLLNEAEKQDKVKLITELNRTYKERLTIEVEKLRALFDVEVAKMQAFYMSSNIYEDDANLGFPGTSSNGDLQNQNDHSPRNDVLVNRGSDMESININNPPGTGDGNSQTSHRDIPFVHTYFSPSTQVSTTMTAGAPAPFSMFENVMAYNSLIHHQHIYAQTSASTNGSNCSQGSGSNSHSGI